MKRKGNLTSPNVLRLVVRRIESGRFRPGDRLIPAVIAREFGGSTIPVREALCQLVGRDILTEQRNKGFAIAPMTSATLRRLYAAHAGIIQQALEQWPADVLMSGRPRGRWALFAAIGRHGEDDAITGVQRYLAGRLALVRKHEEAYFRSAEIRWAMTDSFHSRSVADMREFVARFHEACEHSASSIWRLMTDR